MWHEETMKGQSKEAILLRAEAAANPTHTFEECMDYYTNYSHYYDDVSKYSTIIELYHHLYVLCLGEDRRMFSEYFL